MTTAVKRTLSMRPDIDSMLVAHVRSNPGATLSSTVNAALADYLEARAIEAYQRWDAQADPAERQALNAFSAQDDLSWVAE